MAGASATAATSNFLEPGFYVYACYRMIEAFEMRATAPFKVEGAWINDRMMQVHAPQLIRKSTDPQERFGAIAGWHAP